MMAMHIVSVSLIQGSFFPGGWGGGGGGRGKYSTYQFFMEENMNFQRGEGGGILLYNEYRYFKIILSPSRGLLDM